MHILLEHMVQGQTYDAIGVDVAATPHALGGVGDEV